MTSTDHGSVRISVPSDVRYFRSVRLAVGGLATLVGFDVEAIDDIRIGVDEMCAALLECGDGSEISFEVSAVVGASVRIVGSVTKGTSAVDDDRFSFSRQILSVVSDDFGLETTGETVRFWLERALAAWPVDATST